MNSVPPHIPKAKSAATTNSTNTPRLFVVDTMAIIYRAHFAMLKKPLTHSRGMNISGIFGLTQTLVRLIQREQPQFLAVTSDLPEPTFRHQRYPAYKATREKMPEELVAQLPYIPRLIHALGLPFLTLAGWEADDLIGTLAKRAHEKGLTTIIVSGDKDLMQLLNQTTFLLDPKESQLKGVEASQQRFSCLPHQVPEILGLMGDTSDNIPGIPGVGEKTAAKLISQFDNLENIYKNLHQLPASKLKEHITAHREQAFLSRELATIQTDAPLEINWEALRFQAHTLHNNPEWTKLLNELEFHSLRDQWLRGEVLSTDTSAGTTTLPAALVCTYTLKSLCALRAQATRWKKAKLLVIDTKTTSLDWLNTQLVGMSFCIDAQTAFYLPFHHPRIQAVQVQVWQVLRQLLEDANVPKAGHNLKFDMQVLQSHGIQLQGIRWDTMIASHLTTPAERHHDLDSVALRELQLVKTPIEKLLGDSAEKGSIADVPIPQAAAYAVEDAYAAFQLSERFAPRLKESGQWRLFETLEVPLLTVLMRMERAGIRLDVNGCQQLNASVEKKSQQLRQQIYQLVGQGEFNLNSVPALQQVLYQHLRLHEKLGVRPRRIKLGMGLSTDEETLERMSTHPLPKNLLAWRELNKLRSTYLEQLPTFVHPHTQRIHTHFRQTVAATGRLASEHPNLQNIPIRSEEGRKLRALFLPSSSQHLLLSADYSQIELRVLAHYSQDATFLKAFQQQQDIHQLTAMTLFDASATEITRDMRATAKEVNFGLIYRMGPDRLAQVTQTTREQAKQFIERFFQRYQTVRQLQDELIARARKEGYAQTLLGRKRPLPELRQSQTLAARNAEGAAINTPIQGTAAEIIKCAMLKIDHRLQKEKMKAHMLLSIHDELLLDVPKEELATVEALVQEEMENAVQLRVPLQVDMGNGVNWLSAHP